MKKKVAFSVFVLLLCLVIYGVFIYSKRDEDIKQIKNSCMNPNFERTLKSSALIDDENICIKVLSELPELSPLKTLALQNLYDMHKVDVFQFREEKNKFRYSLLKTKYLKKNCVNLDELNEKCTEEEWNEAIQVSKYINDIEIKNQIVKKYRSIGKKNVDGLSEIVFQYMNQQEANVGRILKKSAIDKMVKNYIVDQMIDNGFDFEIESLVDERAIFMYLLEESNMKYINECRTIYKDLTTETNKRKCFLDNDICFKYYTDIVSCLSQILNVSMEKDWLYREATSGNVLYQSVTYDLLSPKNLAAYIIALAFSREPIDSHFVIACKELCSQMKQTTNQKNKADYYMNLIAKFLNMKELPRNDGDEYYDMLLRGETKQYNEIDFNSKSDPMEFLMYCDITDNSSEKKDALAKFSIWKYKNEEEFAAWLNLYIVNLKKSGLLTSEKKKNTLEYIRKHENDFGYTLAGGAYDFMTSVYYSNVCYLIQGGEDIGLR